MVSEANGREPDSGEGKNPHGCADKAAGEGGREGQGWRGNSLLL